jgi:aspartyl-tRNA(Asn)/glutamyl-tRNA(Gln) amidotransferase subunit A
LFEFSSIEQYHTRLQEEYTSCVQAVEHYLQEIKEKNHLNAFIEVFADEALQKAKQLDQKRKNGAPPGRLHGVVIAIKDVLSYKGHRLSAASKILENFTAVYSATAVEKLLAEEAIIIGRTNCDEFAMGSSNENSAFGNVLNPLDETKVPGGSSGGSAAAVAAGLCMAALGSDTGGSVRQPADFCGIIGLKPTYGRISRHGLVAYASSFDQIGIFSLNIPDAALILEIISGADEFDSTMSQRTAAEFSKNLFPIRNDQMKADYSIAFFPEALNHPSLDPEISTAIKNLSGKLKDEGHDVQPVKFELMDYIVPAYYILTTAEASSNLSRYDGVRYGYRTKGPVHDITEFYRQNRSEGFGKEVKRRIMLGTFVLSAGYYDAYYAKAQKVRKIICDKLEGIFSKYDFIISPTVPSTAFGIGEKIKDPVEMYLADIYTVLANLAAIPAISIPLFKHSNNMPFGLQIMSKKWNELSLLRFSQLLVQHHSAGAQN